ncbi:MAG: AAA family ATPase, partial [Bacteroidales bacterium]|nr:AAA family ATPase [Bacteroidales bacterium]
MQDTSTVYNIANEFAELTARSIFLTGKAGTGKTTFLRKLKEVSLKQIAVVAPTGVAAINAGGVTMHSFFQLPFTPFVPTLEGKRNLISKLKITNVRRKVLQELELLVIDEISMVRADVLDEVDAILRHFRFRP